MAWSAIATVVDGQTITAAWANTIQANLAENPAAKAVATGDFFQATAASVIGRIAPGTVGTVLTAGASLLSYQAIPASALPAGLGVPVGGIVMWNDAAGSIPSGYQACDGTNGTRDLRGKFVVGAGATYAVGATGGSLTPTAAAHTHIFAVQAQTHSHYAWGNIGSPTEASHPVSLASPVLVPAGNHRHWVDVVIGPSGSHAHTLASQAVTPSTIDVTPRYVALHYIQRMS